MAIPSTTGLSTRNEDDVNDITQHITPTPSKTPSRSIRANFTRDTITVYQAYSAPIATAAVSTQKLSACLDFSTTRTTWIKPSWNWMMYRSGYSYKEGRQERVLALKMRHGDFVGLLRRAKVANDLEAKSKLSGGQRRGGRREGKRDGGEAEDEEEDGDENENDQGGVVVQWDPERTVRIGRVDGGMIGGKGASRSVRSIQIGIKGSLTKQWVDEWIVSIEDVTDRARKLKRVLDEDVKGKLTVKDLLERELIPVERVYDDMLPDDVRVGLGMAE